MQLGDLDDLANVPVTTGLFSKTSLLHFFDFLLEHFFIRLSQIASADRFEIKVK